jgi:hypothetical protein
MVMAVLTLAVFTVRGSLTGDDLPSASASASTSQQERTSAAGISFVLPTGWDYVVPPSEWAISLERTPRIYFSNQPMREMDCPYVPPDSPGGDACRPPIQELDVGGVLIYWWVTDSSPTYGMPNLPDAIGGLPGIRTPNTNGSCDGVGADGAEQIWSRQPGRRTS